MKLILNLALLVSIFSTQAVLAEKISYSKYLDSIKAVEMSGDDLNDKEGNPACATAPIIASMYEGGGIQALATSLCQSINKDLFVIEYDVRDERDFWETRKKCYYINNLGMTYARSAQFFSSLKCGKNESSKISKHGK
ncbi:MAG: hypothetical protein PHY93_11510 [Bacteriovorax sp.]|nr:hypothetical protein [Bacteriovorax sp.]